MDDDLSFVLALFGTLLIAGLIALGGCHESETTQRTAIKAGLVQKRVDGQTVWQKP